ncbi:MAG: hypothetical protein WBA76_20690, partial [Phormidesmis sp.]
LTTPLVYQSDSPQADTFTAPSENDWVPELQLDSPPESRGLNNSSTAAPTDPTMQESKALFLPKESTLETDSSYSDRVETEAGAADSAAAYDELDELNEQWQDETWQDSLSDEPHLETSDEAWGEKQTESTPKFEPIPAGAIQRHSENEPDSFVTDDIEESNSLESWEDRFVEADVEADSDAAESTAPEIGTEPIENPAFTVPLDDPTFQSVPSLTQEQANPGN